MIPSREIAKTALMKWNGLKEEEAIAKASEGTGKDAIDSVWAGKSVEDAIEGISKELSLTEEEKIELKKATYDGIENKEIFNKIVTKAQNHPEKEDMIINILSSIHDGWVKDNLKRFDEKLKKGVARQYAPLEIIGWNEAQSDLLFLNPILNSLGITVDMNRLQQQFYIKLAQFLKQNDIISLETLTSFVQKGAISYPALEGIDQMVSENANAIARQIMDNWKENDLMSLRTMEENAKKEDNTISDLKVLRENLLKEIGETKEEKIERRK